MKLSACAHLVFEFDVVKISANCSQQETWWKACRCSSPNYLWIILSAPRTRFNCTSIYYLILFVLLMTQSYELHSCLSTELKIDKKYTSINDISINALTHSHTHIRVSSSHTFASAYWNGRYICKKVFYHYTIVEFLTLKFAVREFLWGMEIQIFHPRHYPACRL